MGSGTDTYAKQLGADSARLVIPIILVLSSVANVFLSLQRDLHILSSLALFFLFPTICYIIWRLLNSERYPTAIYLFLAVHEILLTYLIWKFWVPGSFIPYLFAILIVVSSMILEPYASYRVWGITSLLMIAAIVSQDAFVAANIKAFLAPLGINLLLATAVANSFYDWHHATLTINELYQKVQHRRDELYALKEELQQVNTLLTVTNRQLEVAKTAAEAATVAKSQFLASMSHEIRTPMNGVIGMTSLLQETELDADQQSFVEIIRASGESLLTIINDILDFSKIESNQLELEQHAFDLHACVESAVDLLAHQAALKGIELTCFFDESVPRHIVSDPTRLRQVLVNLLSNAVKFTEKGEVSVRVCSKAIATNRTEITFSIRDTGIGISPEKSDRLFKPFSQVDASTTRKYGGTGLGLVICKRLCEFMGGDIWVESELGEGSTFTFTIVAEPAALPEEEAVASDNSQFANRNVLIVDDNETNRLVLSRTVTNWGMQSESFSSGEEVLSLFNNGHNHQQYDVALLDYDMPAMNGGKLAKALKQVAPNLPIVILSSMGETDKSYQEQVNYWLYKPVKKDQLSGILSQVFHNLSTAKETGLTLPTAARRPSLRILLVEDNNVNQQVALRMLQRFGYQADTAMNGAEAVTAVRLRPYDVVFMDVQMPVMDGLEATRQIRALNGTVAQPWIVAMTADVLDDAINSCLAAGMNDFIGKPATINMLETALEAVPDNQTDATPQASAKQNLRFAP
ncbi:MAG: hypothetical protein CL608_24765 [Anaerolineaceae bacterium]|nr:hypothetical protein [Anaerolineaceae bacterium]